MRMLPTVKPEVFRGPCIGYRLSLDICKATLLADSFGHADIVQSWMLDVTGSNTRGYKGTTIFRTGVAGIFNRSLRTLK